MCHGTCLTGVFCMLYCLRLTCMDDGLYKDKSITNGMDMDERMWYTFKTGKKDCMVINADNDAGMDGYICLCRKDAGNWLSFKEAGRHTITGYGVLCQCFFIIQVLQTGLFHIPALFLYILLHTYWFFPVFYIHYSIRQ